MTLDTGALIALKRRSQRMRRLFDTARQDNLRIVVPADVVAEWWRGRTDLRDAILASVHVEALTTALAKVAGEALAATRGASSVDAIVMASAALRGSVVFTSDIDDQTRLQQHFPGVRVLAV